MSASVTALAHPNIALVKYWGKQQRPGNFPATPSLSITLSALTTTTTITDHDRDEVRLNGKVVADQKIERFLAALREEHAIAPVSIDTSNDFPTAAGLASSASGFAALIYALNAKARLNLDPVQMAAWARQGSASAARSLFGGYVTMGPPDWQASTIAATDTWPLTTVIAITSNATKSVSSSEGMERSRKTSPFYDSWLQQGVTDYEQARVAVAQRDFQTLADVAEANCLGMHSVMLTSKPTLAYWNSATIEIMDEVRSLRSRGVAVFFTIDAGPQVKAICVPEHAETVDRALSALPGVATTLCSDIGGAPILVDA